MSTRRPLVAGNWKMNLGRAQAQALAKELAASCANKTSIDWLVCPPTAWLCPVADELLNQQVVALGGQDVNENTPGAHTGETAAEMLTDAGCRYAIIGHSERRAHYGDSPKRTAAKFQRAVELGLRPVLCVGESEQERAAGQTEAVVKQQLEAVLAQTDARQWEDAVIAYEPVWAIGTGKTASPADAQAVHAFIRSIMREFDARIAGLVRIVYGGSVKPDNAKAIFAGEDVDGALVGGAALKAESFLAIGQAAIDQ
jgi:triosephosphate isomerase